MTAYDDLVIADKPWGYWKLGEASGDPQDTSGNGRHFVNSSTGTRSYQQTAIAPLLAPCINMTAETVRWTRAGLANAPGTRRTMEVWCTRTGAGSGSGAYFFGEWQGNQSRQWGIHRSSTTHFGINGAGEGANGSDRQINMDWTVPASAVHFVTVWQTDDTCMLYADGVRVYDLSTPYRSNNTGTLFIGRSIDAFWGSMYGKIASFAIYDRALSVDRITNHYVAGADLLRRDVTY